MQRHHQLLPALNYDWLTPLYDPIIRWTLRESTIKRDLVGKARIDSGHRVLDLGCGTATLTLLIKRAHPDAEVFGLDGDRKILQIARSKIAEARLDIRLDLGMAYELPYANDTFDRILSSLVFHHLTPEEKSRTTREVLRVLKPGGELHVADFGRPHNNLMRALSAFMRLGHGAGRIEENLEGRLPQIFRDGGLGGAEETGLYSTMFGSISFYQASRPLNPTTH